MADDLLQRLEDVHLSEKDGRLFHRAARRIRELEAQIAAPAVNVKPLVWEVDNYGRRYHPDATRAECPIFGQVCAEKPTDQADVEARRAALILATIEAVPAADLPATDAQALANDKVRALVEAARHLGTWDQCWPGNINLKCGIASMRDALAAMEKDRA